jgi:hypothetical protein
MTALVTAKARADVLIERCLADARSVEQWCRLQHLRVQPELRCAARRSARERTALARPLRLRRTCTGTVELPLTASGQQRQSRGLARVASRHEVRLCTMQRVRYCSDSRACTSVTRVGARSDSHACVSVTLSE